MTTLIARLKDILDAANYQSELLYVLRERETVLRIVAALEAADMLLDEVAQAAPLLDMFPDDLAVAMGGMRAALAALEEE